MDIQAALEARLGPGTVLVGEAIPARNLTDWSGLGPVRPAALVRPRSTEEVATVLRVCHRLRVPVVPQGGLTGLCGGARPTPGSVVLSLERLVGVEEIDPAMATLTVRAGTPLEVVQRAAEEAGFLVPLDLGARGSCAIGGNLATNAGGNRVIRYGMAREMVLGLEVVLADGTIVCNLNKMIKNNAGYDWKQLFIGSEGTLGVITRAVLRLWPLPGFTTAAFCGLSDFAAVVRLLEEARAGLGPLLSAFEVMWPRFYDLVVARATGVRAPLAGRHGFYVLLEAQGTEEAFDAPRFAAFLERMHERGVVADAAVAQSRADVRAFWAIRDAVAEWGRILGPHFGFDLGLPIEATERFAQEAEAALQARFPGAVAVFFGHLGDSNLHVVVHVPGSEEQPYEAIAEILYGLVRAFGGTVSAEHGIGTLKKPWLGHARSEAEIALMRALKRALDPAGILNPGKVVEFGA
ncbi:MAG: FAD-binding oxidoreductase [Geminicoccaceae bacterium]|nr:FAD-binding oxidoreductase [Geminicoccaceae bacterium]MDW8340326.1 FAD-binding oxidoreductase [Geminicoccaceae bacterium]